MSVFVAIAIPSVVGGIAVASEPWLPLGDFAAMVFQISQVGTRHTALVGPYSARGFSHPGPLLFWVGAVPYQLAGGDARSLLVVAATVNAASAVVIGWLAGQLGGRTLQVVTAFALALLLHDLGANILVNPWNPLISLLPFLLLLFCLWAAALGRRRALFGCAITGAWVVQAHVGYFALLVVVIAWLAVWLFAHGRRSDARGTPDPPLVRPLGTAILVFFVLMAPALLDQFFGRHNLSALWRSFVTSPQNRIGIEDAAGVVSRFLQPIGPWTGSSVPVDFGGSMVGAGLASLALVSLLLIGLLLLAWRLHRIDVAVPVSLALTLDLAAVPVASRISPPALEYLVEWLHPLGAFTWLVIGWGIIRLVPWPAVVRRQVPMARALVAVAAVAIAITIVPSAREPVVPDAAQAPTVRAALDQVHAAIRPGRGSLRVDATGDTFGQATSGIIADLIGHDFRVRTEIGRDMHVWNREFELQPAEQTDRTLTIVVTGAALLPGAAPSPCSLDPSQRRIADASADERPGGPYRIEVYEGRAPCAAPGAAPP
jgi:hypothetical protein